jgi:hypothetical protein
MLTPYGVVGARRGMTLSGLQGVACDGFTARQTPVYLFAWGTPCTGTGPSWWHCIFSSWETGHTFSFMCISLPEYTFHFRAVDLLGAGQLIFALALVVLPCHCYYQGLLDSTSLAFSSCDGSHSAINPSRSLTQSGFSYSCLLNNLYASSR